ncbi:hypothetical protein EC957_011268 [Mortierella hygrophila]|uniref:Uncharacterized protein n=1 Tax=Mortierella hygrophila TaxID=979708 RepID=A0A9P6K3X0_9FUNG|nr:hypothetical protein EC957_011268 [Mortierella hygrophila]
MLARKTLSAGIPRQAMRPQQYRHQHQVRTLAISALCLQEQPRQETSAVLNDILTASSDAAPVEDTGKKTPYRSARYILEQTQNQAGRRLPRRDNNSNDNTGSSSSGERRFNNSNNRGPRPARNNRYQDNNFSPASKFQSPPTIPYDISKELQFAEKSDWEVSSVLDARPLYANIAASRGTTPTLGVSTLQDRTNVVAAAIPGTAFSAHITGVRSHGDFDAEVEQSLIQTLAPLAGDSSKDHRKKSDVAAVEHQAFLHHMTHNFQEIMNPRNSINRFNNGGVKHVAGIKYDIGSDEASTVEGAEEKSWRRLERLGGDYSRASSPLSLLSKSEGKTGKVGQEVLKNVSDLIGQNQSIGLEDKKKFLKAVESGLGGI